MLQVLTRHLDTLYFKTYIDRCEVNASHDGLESSTVMTSSILFYRSYPGMEAAGTSEILVSTYRIESPLCSTDQNIREDLCENHKPRNFGRYLSLK